MSASCSELKKPGGQPFMYLPGVRKKSKQKLDPWSSLREAADHQILRTHFPDRNRASYAKAKMGSNGLRVLHWRTILSSFHGCTWFRCYRGTCERAVSHSFWGATPFFGMDSRLAGAG
jgi:hypothetical protein